MIRGFYTASLGIRAQQTHMDVLSNNMANTNTYGYKTMRASFADLLYENVSSLKGPSVNTGHGARVEKTDLRLGQGPFMQTYRNLDFAIEGDGFFAVQDSNGETFYTRDGNFQASRQDGSYYLVTSEGHYVLDNNEQPIILDLSEETANTIELDKDMFGVFKFANPYALVPAGSNVYTISDEVGERTLMVDAAIESGYLEGSGVEVADQMVKVIESQRAFQFNSRILQVTDEIEQTVNGLRQ